MFNEVKEHRVTDQEMTKLQGLITKLRREPAISGIFAILFTTVAVYFFFSQETIHAKVFGFLALTQWITLGLGIASAWRTSGRGNRDN